MAARGKFKEKSWRRSSGEPATIDDITVIVIPILPYKHEVCSPGCPAGDEHDRLPDSPDEEVELEVHFDEKKIVIEAGDEEGLDAVNDDEVMTVPSSEKD